MLDSTILLHYTHTYPVRESPCPEEPATGTDRTNGDRLETAFHPFETP